MARGIARGRRGSTLPSARGAFDAVDFRHERRHCGQRGRTDAKSVQLRGPGEDSRVHRRVPRGDPDFVRVRTAGLASAARRLGRRGTCCHIYGGVGPVTLDRASKNRACGLRPGRVGAGGGGAYTTRTTSTGGGWSHESIDGLLP